MRTPLLIATADAPIVAVPDRNVEEDRHEPAITGVAAPLSMRDGDRSALPWVAVAFALDLAALVITMAIREPPSSVVGAPPGSPIAR